MVKDRRISNTVSLKTSMWNDIDNLVKRRKYESKSEIVEKGLLLFFESEKAAKEARQAGVA